MEKVGYNYSKMINTAENEGVNKIQVGGWVRKREGGKESQNMGAARRRKKGNSMRRWIQEKLRYPVHVLTGSPLCISAHLDS